jgi:hypothetical protein
MRKSLAATAPWLAALALGCPARPPLPLVLRPPPQLADCPGSLRSTEELEGDWVVHERLRVRAPEVDEGYALVLQKTGPKLVLVGLTAFGAKAFSVTQIGSQVWTESYLGRALAVPPENVLRDVHRAHFLTSEAPGFEGRTVTRDPDGAVHIASASCGYQATLAPVSVAPPRVTP